MLTAGSKAKQREMSAHPQCCRR